MGDVEDTPGFIAYWIFMSFMLSLFVVAVIGHCVMGWSDPSAPANHSHFLTKAQRVAKQQAKERQKLLQQRTLIKQRSESRRAQSMSSLDEKARKQRRATDSPTGVGSFKNSFSDAPGAHPLAQTLARRYEQKIPRLVSTMETLFRLHDESMRELADSKDNLATFLDDCGLGHHATRLNDFGIDSFSDIQDQGLVDDKTLITKLGFSISDVVVLRKSIELHVSDKTDDLLEVPSYQSSRLPSRLKQRLNSPCGGPNPLADHRHAKSSTNQSADDATPELAEDRASFSSAGTLLKWPSEDFEKDVNTEVSPPVSEKPSSEVTREPLNRRGPRRASTGSAMPVYGIPSLVSVAPTSAPTRDSAASSFLRAPRKVNGRFKSREADAD